MWKRILCICCMVASLIVMVMPFGVKMNFADGPHETITRYYSYFSDIPWGYGNWFPMLTAVLSVAAIVLLIPIFGRGGMRAARLLTGAAALCSLLSWLIFDTFTAAGVAVCMLHGVVCVLLIVGKAIV